MSRADTSGAPSAVTGFGGRLAVLGAGTMAGAVLSGMLEAGLDPARVVVTAASEGTRSRWRDAGVEVAPGNADAARGADVVVLGVKPYLVADVLDEIAPELGADSVVVSLAAGVTLAGLTAHAGDGVPVVRVMPNTPALVGEGAFVVTAGESCTPEQVELVEGMLRTCGRTEIVPERLQNAATGLSGSGPAYVFYVVDALVEAGVLEGLPRPVATRLAVQTLYGAAAMLRDDDTSAVVRREQVTSPGGSTAAALRALDAGAVRYHLGRAVSESARRSAELAD